MTDVSKEEYLKQLRKELHKPVIRKFQKRKVLAYRKDEADENDGYKWMLNIVDCLTRFAWSVPMKTKHAKVTLAAFKTVIENSERKPERMWVDLGGEFIN